MIRPLLALSVFALIGAVTPARPALHCQVPCGIYGDQMRVAMMLEDAATVEKAMAQIVELSRAEAPNYNQLVRWVTNKESHAQSIQDTVAAYWLAQRVKKPTAEDKGGREKYLRQLALMHDVTTSAMKCKQTTDKANVEALRKAVMTFSETYFSPEDMAHIKEHQK